MIVRKLFTMVLVCFVFIAKTQPNIFKESLVTSVTPWEIIEESDVFPDNFSFPAYTGSGIIFYGLDATGFQSINFDLSTKWIPSNGGTADDLYVFHKRMHSNHLGWDDIGKYPVSQMPLGYMSFSIIVDGQRIAPGLFIYTAKNWRRKTDLKSGLITTSYDLPQGVRLEVAHLLVMNTITPQYRVSVSSIDNRPHTVDFRYETKVRTRDGKPIWDDFPEFHYDSDKGIYVTASLHDNGRFQTTSDYHLSWGVMMQGGLHSIDTALVEYTGLDQRPDRLIDEKFNISQTARRVTMTAEKRLDILAGGTDSVDFTLFFGTRESGVEKVKKLKKRYGLREVPVLRAQLCRLETGGLPNMQIRQV